MRSTNEVVFVWELKALVVVEDYLILYIINHYNTNEIIGIDIV